MKSIIRTTLMFLVVGVVAISCESSKPKQTIENLKSAITGESNASAMYMAFSVKAAEDGYPNISKMFAAATTAEAIHVNNHNAVLVTLGEEVYTAEIEIPEMAEIAENLQTAIDGETYEFTVMYPAFLADAETEKCNEAITSFTWALQAEASHARLYTIALQILEMTGSDETVAPVWYTCPQCGDLYDTIEELDFCSICAMSTDSFLIF